MSNHVEEATYFDYLTSALSPTSNPNSYDALLKDFGSGGVASGPSGRTCDPDDFDGTDDDLAGRVTLTTAKGTGSCALTDSQLAPGLYVVDAVTPSGPDFVGSFSNLAGLTVTAPSSDGPLGGLLGLLSL